MHGQMLRAKLLFYPRKEIVAAAAVIAARTQTALLESGVRNGMDRGRCDRAFL